MKRASFVTAKCCVVGREFVQLRYLESTYYGFDNKPDEYRAYFRTVPPFWVIDAHNACLDAGAKRRLVVVKHCPFCGVSLPKPKLRMRPPQRIMTITDGGYYCTTCKRRLMACKCKPPERLWRA